MTQPERFAAAPISQLIGFDVVPATEQDRLDGKAVVYLDVSERLHNPMGRVHGGVIAALADAAMGIAFGRTLEKHQDFSTIEMSVQFMRPVRANRLMATGLLVQRGLRIGFVRCEIKDDRDRLIATATCSCTTVES